jgi:hypothetical protein
MTKRDRLRKEECRREFQFQIRKRRRAKDERKRLDFEAIRKLHIENKIYVLLERLETQLINAGALGALYGENGRKTLCQI